jgi:hypothetical protein
MAKQQVVRDVADRRTARVLVATDRQQQLMLRRRQSGGLGLLLAPSLELSQAGPERQKARINRV